MTSSFAAVTLMLFHDFDKKPDNERWRLDAARINGKG